MRRARLGSMLGSSRGSAAGCRPPLPLRLCGGVRYARCATSARAHEPRSGPAMRARAHHPTAVRNDIKQTLGRHRTRTR
jgi:hypothetical protein